MKLAPVVLFVYDRPEHTRRTLEALSNNFLSKDTILIVFCDGPKMGASKQQLDNIVEVRKIVRSQSHFKDLIVNEKDVNKGLADSIIDGVTHVVNEHDRVIVLEDDIETSPGFLSYMNDALEIYESNKQVMHISGYFYPVNISNKETTTFLKVLSCWGWATWKRAWDEYEHNIDVHLSKLSTKSKIEKFNINGAADFYSQLILNKNKTIYTWAVRWYASWLFKGGISLFPTKTLVKNIGHDGSGVHSLNTNKFDSEVTESIKLKSIPVKEDNRIRGKINSFYKSLQPKQAKGVLRNLKKSLTAFVRINLREILFYNNHLLSFSNYIISSSISNKAKLYTPYEIIGSEVGDYSYISKNAHLSNTDVGKFCSIGPNLVSGWGIHPTNCVSTSPCFYSTKRQNGISFVNNNTFVERKKIQIGNDVFIGANVVILDGVTIGNGAIIGAGAVVSKNIPPYAIAVGVPAEIIRYRFESDKIVQLQGIKWWDWPIEEIKEIKNNFFDIDNFLNKSKNKG